MNRVINIWYDVTSNVLREGPKCGDTLQPSQYPWITFREEPVINLHLVTDDDLTEYKQLAGTEEFTFSIDNEFVHSDQLMCKTLDAGVNVAGTWYKDPTAPGNPDPTVGELSAQMAANTIGFQTKIAEVNFLRTTQLQVQVIEATQVKAVFRMPIICFNNVEGAADAAPAVLAGLITEEIIDGEKALVFRNSDGVILFTMEAP